MTDSGYQTVTFKVGRTEYSLYGVLNSFEASSIGGSASAVVLKFMGELTRTSLPPLHACPNCSCE